MRSFHPTFLCFFGKLLRFYENTVDAPKYKNSRAAATFEITAYIQEHHNDITLSKLAERYHYTPEYTSRFIKEATGKTFSDILIDSRMKHAISLLKTTSLPIAGLIGLSLLFFWIRLAEKLDTTILTFQLHMSEQIPKIRSQWCLNVMPQILKKSLEKSKKL